MSPKPYPDLLLGCRDVPVKGTLTLMRRVISQILRQYSTHPAIELLQVILWYD